MESGESYSPREWTISGRGATAIITRDTYIQLYIVRFVAIIKTVL